MWFEQHCARTVEMFGDSYAKVHLWLDELAHVNGKFDPGHRKHRHTREGIQQVCAWWGVGAGLAAEQHLLDDFFGPGPHSEAQRLAIPADTADYVKRGWM
jgi:hypothetical protein